MFIYIYTYIHTYIYNTDPVHPPFCPVRISSISVDTWGAVDFQGQLNENYINYSEVLRAFTLTLFIYI